MPSGSVSSVWSERSLEYRASGLLRAGALVGGSAGLSEAVMAVFGEFGE